MRAFKSGSSKNIANGYTLRVVNYVDDATYDVLTVVPREITVTTGSATKPYDGTALTDSSYYVSYGLLGTGHKLSIEVTGTISNVGTARNFVNKESLKITDKNGKDVTKNYVVTFELGYLTIK